MSSGESVKSDDASMICVTTAYSRAALRARATASYSFPEWAVARSWRAACIREFTPNTSESARSRIARPSGKSRGDKASRVSGGAPQRDIAAGLDTGLAAGSPTPWTRHLAAKQRGQHRRERSAIVACLIQVNARFRVPGHPLRLYPVRLGTDVGESDVGLTADQPDEGEQRIGVVHLSEQRMPKLG